MSAEPIAKTLFSTRQVRDTIRPMKEFRNTRRRLEHAENTAFDKNYLF